MKKYPHLKVPKYNRDNRKYVSEITKKCILQIENFYL